MEQDYNSELMHIDKLEHDYLRTVWEKILFLVQTEKNLRKTIEENLWC